jgi:deoxyribonuclease V
MTPDQAIKVQRQLAVEVSRRNEVEAVGLVAGVDISAPNAAGLARAAVVVLSYPELMLVEKKVIKIGRAHV